MEPQESSRLSIRSDNLSENVSEISLDYNEESLKLRERMVTLGYQKHLDAIHSSVNSEVSYNNVDSDEKIDT